MARKKISKGPRRQKPIVGGRIQVSAAFIPEIERRIRQDMRRFNVCRSFVIALICANHYSIEEQEQI